MTIPRLALAALALALAGAGCKHTGTTSSTDPNPAAAQTTADAAVAVAAVSPSSYPSKPNAMPQTTSAAYVTPWVDGTRASRTLVPRRAIRALERVSSLEGPASASDPRLLGHVEHVLAAPDGEHIVVRGADAAWVFDTKGAHVATVPGGAATGFTFVTRAGVFHQLNEYDWGGRQTSREVWLVFGSPGHAWATRVHGDDVFVINQQGITGNHSSKRLQRMVLSGDDFVQNGLIAKAKIIGANELENVYAMGAIAKNGELTVMTTAGELDVFAPEGDDTSELKKLHTSHTRISPYDIANVESGIACLESLNVPALDDAEWRGSYQVGTDLFLRFAELGVHWKTKLHALSMRGTALFEVTVPFEVLQPPVDGGGGRIYLAGMGFAAIQDGKVLWSQAPTARTLVTAFLGGEVALAVGSTLRIVDRDGHVGESSVVAAGESIATPPAIAPDGAVWVATEKALYVAR